MSSYASDPRKVDGPGIPAALEILTRLTTRHYVSQCIYTFVKIGVPDAMGGEVLTPSEIAMRLKMYVNVDYLARILRLLSTEGLVAEHKSNAGSAVYTLTDAGKLLQTDVPEQPTLGAFMKQEFNPVTWKAWGKLHEAILVPPSSSKDETTSIGNAIPFKVETGMEYFPYMKKNQQYAESFSNAMDVYTAHELPVVLKYDWTKLNGKTVVDVGGSYGTTMENVANAFPDIGKCISLDTPEIIQIAPKPSNKKVELVAGDFFDSSTIPKCDAIFMKRILHDWNDDMAKRIIKACHEALNEGGCLIISEHVVAEIGDSSPDTIPVKELDILMMVLLGGRERSAKEWEALICADSLFKLENAIPPTGDISVFSFVKM